MLFLLLKRLFTAASERELFLEDCKRITPGLLNNMIDMEFPQKENDAQKNARRFISSVWLLPSQDIIVHIRWLTFHIRKRTASGSLFLLY